MICFTDYCSINSSSNQAFMFPSIHSISAKWTPPNERSRLIGFIFSGKSILEFTYSSNHHQTHVPTHCLHLRQVYHLVQWLPWLVLDYWPVILTSDGPLCSMLVGHPD